MEGIKSQVKRLYDSDSCVAIIILHHRGAEILTDCLESLFKTKYECFDIILVDNGSTDGSVQLVEKKYDKHIDVGRLKIIKSVKNLGFVRGNNLALQHVLSIRKYKYLVLLNDDTIVDPNWLGELIKVAERDCSIGALQPKLKSLHKPSFFEYNGACGGMLDVYGVPFCRGRIFDLEEKDKGQYDTVAEVFWAGGAAMFLRVEALKEAGLLDDFLYAHMEEIDLSWRLRLLGYKIFCVPSAVVYHLGGQTPLPSKYYLKARNNIIVMLKNYSSFNIMRYLPLRTVLDLLSMIFYLVQNEDNKEKSLSIIKAYIWLLKNFRYILASRRQCQLKRRLSDNLLTKLMMQKSIVIQYYLMKRKYFWQVEGLPRSLLHYTVGTAGSPNCARQTIVPERYYRKYMKMLYWDLANISSFNELKHILRTTDTILDIGCGIGYFSRLFDNYVGVDTNIFAVKIAKKHFHHNDFVCASATRLPFKDKGFRYAISYDCIEHIDDVKSFLLETTRVSKRSIIGCVDFGSYYQVITKTIRRDPTHFFELPRDQLVKLIKKYVKVDRVFFTCGIFSLPKRLNRFLARYFPEYLLVMISDMAEEKSLNNKVSL